ncbi:MAG TPA: adenylate/guanylate cyclase domain-containing protein [Planctomycetota bacterium]|nr:adenylate/guanylate cyclase domain-containing protein [Planctomycetota bacterium]
MANVTVLPDNKTIPASEDQTLLSATLAAGIPHIHACGGRARCSTCRVQVTKGLEHCHVRGPEEQTMAERLHFAPEVRLACQTRVNGDVTIRRMALDHADEVVLAQNAGGTAIAPIGEEKRIAILFSDIRGFTTFSEHLPPYDVIHVLNRYFFEMAKPIEANGGCIDNYMGDGLMALFGMDNAPDPSLRAVKAGLGMLAALEGLKPYLQSLYGTTFRIGIGVHIGEVVVGTIGQAGKSHNKRTTAIGDAVNFASRIEGENKAAGTNFLISEAVYKEVNKSIQTGKTVRVNIKGKSGLYTLYEVLGLIESTARSS